MRLREGQTATEEIRDHRHGKIAHYRVPRYVKSVDGLPMTVTQGPEVLHARDEREGTGLEDAAQVQMA